MVTNLNCYLSSSVSSLKSKLFTDMLNFNCYPSGRCTHVSPLKKSQSQSDTKLETLSRAQKPWFLERSIFENAYLLLPSVFGTGIAFLISLKSESRQIVCNNNPKVSEKDTNQGSPNEHAKSASKLIALTYVFGSITGIAMFIYRSVMGSYTKHPLNNLLPAGIGLVSATLLFASVNFAMFVLFPTSFNGQIGKHWVEQAISFIYYSALGISVGSSGDILPTEITTRLLLALEGIANLVIFGLLIASIFG